MKEVDSIVIVGGGTAGCIAALILKTRFPQKEIKIIESSKVGIVGVGESSTEHWAQFCKFVGINQLDAILHCNATFKGGIYYENWADKDFIHSINSPHSDRYGSYFGVFGYLISNNKSPKELCHPHSLKNEISTNNFTDLNDSPTNQYHYDTFALNAFLHKKCEERGIDIIDDELTGVTLDEQTGDIRSVLSDNWEHFADFFIDCSGFARILMNKTYNIKWKSYSEYLPVNSAFVFQTEEPDEYNKYTKITARNAGWSWTIPTQTRTGNGYVYSDKFISIDEAHREMEEAYGQSLSIGKTFKFDIGRLEKCWHKNCFSVGLSQSFIEPLEATSISSTIQQTFCFMHYLPSYDIDSCNEEVNVIYDNSIDYVQAHYLVKKEDTPFWKDVKYNLKLTPGLEKNLKRWKNRLPMPSDVTGNWRVFSAVNYIQILYGLGWFDIEKVKEEYDNYAPAIENDVIYKLNNDVCNHYFSISHKKFINEILMNKREFEQNV
jgi:hypothetical protein